MPDAIPAARYYDATFDAEFICNGIVDDEQHSYAVVEYDDVDGTISIPLTAFKNDTQIEVLELPEGQN